MDRQQLLQEVPHKEKNGIFVVNSPTAVSANKTVERILTNYCDSKTALFLSGGRTPIHLFEAIAVKKCIKTGAVGLVDERFGEKWHKGSNELMIKNTGILDYFESLNIRFYPILQDSKKKESVYHKLVYDTTIEQIAKDYDESLRFLFKYFPKTVGILGIGEDGHTAGIPAGNSKSQIPNPKLLGITKRILEDQSSLVTYYEDESGKYGARVTMTFLALGQLDLIILLVLGQEKREALKLMFDDGSIEETPAKFYLQPEIAEKTILITDQIV
ncbi:MAG: 6-phosphogluconolactonase [Candidatus Levybacteria bacterium]|nr:6-phosphogluconolactonase [Candidatus Levybacteria bacterium]